ncbi:MAG: DUF6361 family protein [Gammaproteobacteria bacterium]
MATSSLTWLDHDASEQERMRRLLGLFEEQGTVDELGIGTIRDSIADQLFPGTSTIQTRLRYFLFVPWIYRQLEEKRSRPDRLRAEARKLQYQLSRALLEGGESEGVIGGFAGRDLKRTPDEIYWGGLLAWGIRRYPGSIARYQEGLDRILHWRTSRLVTDDGESLRDPRGETWHPDLPEPPADLLEETTFSLTREEADFLQERIRLSHPDSLIGILAGAPSKGDYEAPWMHPAFATLPERTQHLLSHAHRFSDTMHGAALLYNLMLARAGSWEEMTQAHGEALAEWIEEIDPLRLRAWDLAEFWALVVGHGHRITLPTRLFVERWVEFVAGDKHSLDRPAVHRLIELREKQLKGPRAMLQNKRALEQWSGSSGLSRLTYRWKEAQRYLNELAEGLRAG